MSFCPRRHAEYHSAVHRNGELHSPGRGVQLRGPLGAASCTRRSAEYHSAVRLERRVALAAARSTTPRSPWSGELHSPTRGVQLRGPLGAASCTRRSAECNSAIPLERRVALAGARSTTPRSRWSGELYSPGRGVPLRDPLGAASCTRRGAEYHSAIPLERRVVLAGARSTTPRSRWSGELHSPGRGVQLRDPLGAASCTRRGAECHSAVRLERRVALAGARSITPRSAWGGELHSPGRGVQLRDPLGAASCTRRGAECNSAVRLERRVVLAGARSTTPRSHWGGERCEVRMTRQASLQPPF
jgi:hypothetical protein